MVDLDPCSAHIVDLLVSNSYFSLQLRSFLIELSLDLGDFTLFGIALLNQSILKLDDASL